MNDLLGNSSVKQLLSKIVSSKKVAHTYLFQGPEGVGKGLFATAFAKALIESEKSDPPDLIHLRPEGKIGMHAIDRLRQFTDAVALRPLEAPYKVFIIHDAERMLPTSSNALLKTIEEPPEQTVIILLSSEPERLLPTILSRCIKVRFSPLAPSELRTLLKKRAFSDEKIDELIPLAHGSASEALHLAERGVPAYWQPLYALLSEGPHLPFSLLASEVKTIAEQFETLKEELKTEAEREIYLVDQSALSAVQRQAFDRECEGWVSSRFSRETARLFSMILAWYRDLHLLRTSGNRELLTFPSSLKTLENIAKHPLPSLEKIQKAVKEAELSLQRFNPLASELQALFLQMTNY